MRKHARRLTSLTHENFADSTFEEVPYRDPRTKDETGSKFGKLTVLNYAGTDSTKAGGAMWLCRCTCGNTRVARGGQLRQGRIVTCGKCPDLPVGDSLLTKISWVGKPPCERGCSFYDDCLEQELACSQFSYWAKWGGKIFPDPDNCPPNKQEYLKNFQDDQ